MKRYFGMVAAYSAAHFAVDFACAFLMFAFVGKGGAWYTCVLLYNFCAFAMQLPMGLVADRLDKNRSVALLGCALVAVAYALSGAAVASCVVAGLGNGLFHVGGGIDVLNTSQKKSGALGVFVSPGAFGIYFGTLMGKASADMALLPLCLLVAAAGLMLAFCGRKHTERNAPLSFDEGRSGFAVAALLCLLFVVVLRSYVGSVAAFPWKSQGQWALVLVCGVVFGKAAGGFLCDKIGALFASALSLALSAAAFMLSDAPVFGVLAMFLFNMTMPITLWAVARLLPNAKGFAFGLLTFGLFLGFLPSYFGWSPAISGNAGLAAACAVSLALMWVGLRGAQCLR